MRVESCEIEYRSHTDPPKLDRLQTPLFNELQFSNIYYLHIYLLHFPLQSEEAIVVQRIAHLSPTSATAANDFSLNVCIVVGLNAADYKGDQI